MKCLIIAAHMKDKIRDLVNPDDYGFIICADNSFVLAEQEGIHPDLVIGDFDHEPEVDYSSLTCEVIRLPAVKDDTDTHYCIKEAISRGMKDLSIIGGTGGRLDHTLANIQSLVFACKNGAQAILIDKKNIVTVTDKNAELTKNKKYLSVLAVGGKAIVSIEGCKYSPEEIELTESFPVGVSNEICSKMAHIHVIQGTVVLIQSDD